MAIILMEAFDQYNTLDNAGLFSRWTNWTFDDRSGLMTGRFHGNTVKLQFCGTYLSAPTALLDYSMGCAMYPSNYFAATGNIIGAMDSSNNRLVGIVVPSDGSVHLYIGGTDVVHSGPNAMPYNMWSYFEMEVHMADTGGWVNVYVNGALILTYSGDTLSGTVGATRFHIGSFNFGICGFDDFYVSDSNTRVGELRVDILTPVSDDASCNWTPSTGSDHYAMVDEVPANGNTDYVQGPSVGYADLYGISAMGTTPDSIYAVQVMSYDAKTDAGTRVMRNNLKSGATLSNGANITLSTNYTYYVDIWAVDPATSAAWTVSAVNAALIGLEVVS